MLNPQSASKSPVSSRIALPLALLLAGIFGLGVAAVQPLPVAKKTVEDGTPAVEEAPPAHGSEGPLAWNGGGLAAAEPESSTEDLIEFCTRHVTGSRSFVIFRRGTCVIVNEPSEDPMADARKILARSGVKHARFRAEPTSEGDLIVAFEDPVFHRFHMNEVAQLLPWLEKTAVTLMTPEETVSAGDGWTPPKNAQVGLLARRRLMEDAAEAIPVKIIRAKERAVAAR